MLKKALSKRVMCLVVTGSILSPTAAWAEGVTKDETVYTTLSSDGALKSQTVVDWIHSDSVLNQIEDKSTLSNIKNLKGSEAPNKNGDSLIWNTDKNDIYYQGDTNKSLPLSFKITYLLNDKEISANDIAGKSGKVKIRISITNNDKHIVNVGGKARTIYSLIPVATVIALPSEHFSNINTNGGTLAKAGNYNIVAFASIPGLMDSLGLKNGDYGITLPDPLEVTTDAKNFTLSPLPIYMLATPNIIDMNKFAGANTIDGLKQQIMDAKTKLDQLHTGVNTLSDYLKKYKDGIATMNDQLNNTRRSQDGTPQGLKMAEATFNGAIGQLGNGLQTQIKPGADQLFEAVQALDNKINTKDTKDGKPAGLVGATDQLYNTVVTLNDGFNGEKGLKYYINLILKNFSSEGKDKDGNPAGMREGLIEAQAGVQILIDNTRKLVNSAQKDPVLALALVNHGLADPSDPTGAKTLAQLQQLQDAMKMLVSLTSLQVESSECDADKAKTMTDALTIYKNNIEYIADQTKANAPDAKLFDDSVHQLGDIIHSQLLPGVQQLDGGINTVSTAVNTQLAPNSNKLNGYVTQLADTVNSQFLPYITQISDTVNTQLTPGVNDMYNKVSPAISSITDIMAAKDDLVKISSDANNFSGIDEGMKGSVKYVIQTNEIKVGNSDVKKTLKKEKKSFWKKAYEGFWK